MEVRIKLPNVSTAYISVPDEYEHDYIISSISAFGNWEPNVSKKVLALFFQSISENINGVFIDVGACFGYYSILASLLNIPSIAYEPNPRAYGVLNEYKTRNTDSGIELRPYALGQENQNAFLDVVESNIGAAHINENASGLSIVTKKLDEENISEKIILLKLDVEGKEYDVIKGGLAVIKENPPEFILIEVSPKFSNTKVIIDGIFTFLWEQEYLSYDIGLQDSGNVENAINTFRRFENKGELKEYLMNIGQTNFLFIKKMPKVNSILTGAPWKDELILKWQSEYLISLQIENNDLKNKFINLHQVNSSLKIDHRLYTSRINKIEADKKLQEESLERSKELVAQQEQEIVAYQNLINDIKTKICNTI